MGAAAPSRPGPPAHLVATPVNTAIAVSWKAPSSTGGKATTRYLVTISPGLKRCITSSTSCMVSGLTNGKAYSVEVQAENVAGFGKGAVANSVKPTRMQDCAYRGPFANLQKCNLSDTDLGGIDLMNADLTDAQLTDANISGTRLAGTNMTGATLYGVSSGGIVGLPTGLPSGWRLVRGYMLGPTTNLVDANLAGLNLGSLNLSHANLVGVTSGQISGAPGLPAGWSLVDGYLVGAQANLTNANLSNADLGGTDLDGTKLSGAVLSGVSSGGIVGIPSSLPDGWMIVHGYLVGPEANLIDANFSNADLEYTDLDGAALSGADLTGVSSGLIVGPPSSLPTGWLFTEGYLVGPSADLKNAALVNAAMDGADLNDVDLTGADLTGITSGGITGVPLHLPALWGLFNGYLVGPFANLGGADLSSLDLANGNLSGANFTDADLDDSDLTNTDLSDVLWDNTTCPDGTNSNADRNTCADDLGFVDSDAIAQQDLEDSLSLVNSIYSTNGASFPSTANLEQSLINIDPSLTFTVSSSTHPNVISVFSSSDGNGVILAAYAPISETCWYIYDNQGAVADAEPFAPYGPAPTGGSPNNVLFPEEPTMITVTNWSGTYYAEVKDDPRSSDCVASQPVAGSLSQYEYQSIGFPEL